MPKNAEPDTLIAEEIVSSARDKFLSYIETASKDELRKLIELLEGKDDGTR